jgi:hypothetical protein
MALFKESEILSRAYHKTGPYLSAEKVLNEKVLENISISTFDIFLSHSFSDQKLILGVWLTLEDLGYKVYLDWMHDRQLSRDQVNKSTASVLRSRMLRSKCLFYATTENSTSSKWMPWELGLKDGHNGKAAILPISKTYTSIYTGQEYLSLYPYVSEGKEQVTLVNKLWIHNNESEYVNFDSWLTGATPIKR